jgi:hypothetical protein
VEIALAVASRRRRLVAAVLGAEAFQGRPRLDQRAVDRKMLVREEVTLPPEGARSAEGGSGYVN